MGSISQIMPTIRPVTALNMNYAVVITAGVMLLAGFWYLVSARKYYDGPRKTLPDKNEHDLSKSDEELVRPEYSPDNKE
jgi:hypothetical protein